MIDAAGASITLKIALDLVRPAGWISKVGWGPQPLGFNIDPLVQKNVTLQGSFSHNWPIWERVLALLERLGFDLFASELLHTDSDGNLMVLTGLVEFREHLGGELTITLLEAIGRGVEVHEMNLPKVVESIQRLQERHAARTRKVVAVAG